MGRYARPSDVRKRFKKIDTAGKKLVDTDIAFEIKFAESEIDSKLALRYSLPFSTVPDLVKHLAIELSLIYVLDKFFTGEISTRETSKSDWRTVRKDRVDKLLKDIVSGDALLVLSDGTIIDSKDEIGNIQSNLESYEPTFNMLDPINQKIDQDRLDAELDRVNG